MNLSPGSSSAGRFTVPVRRIPGGDHSGRRRRARWGPAALTMLVGAACSTPEVTGRGTGNNGGSASAGRNGSNEPGDPAVDRPNSGGPAIILPDASAALDLGPPPPETCAEENHAATRVPLDVFFLIDGSGSMSGRAGMRSKLDLVRDAVNAFLKNPKSEGIGAGLAFFPVIPTCEKDSDCPSSAVPFLIPGRCVPPTMGCVAPAATKVTGYCSTAATTCPAPSTCTNVGRCPSPLGFGSTSCVIGTTCPDGTKCVGVPRTCSLPFGADCTGGRYAKFQVPFADLPGALPALTTALEQRAPSGGTPLGEALMGTLPALKAQMTAHPDRRVVLVVVSDGAPDTSCGGTAGVLAGLAGARMATPSLTTYGIGVFGGVELVDGRALMMDIARAGGTIMAYVLEPNVNLTETFLKALNEIRGAALPCEFMIPAGKDATIDYGKVNLRFRRAASDELIGYVGTADKCDATKGGWHYDVDPRTGGKPSRVVVCPATCTSLKADGNGKVELRFGCKTVGVD